MAIHEYVWFMKGEDVTLSAARNKVIEYLTHEKTEIVPDTVDGVLFSLDRIRSYRDYNDYVVLAAAKRLDKLLLTYDQRLKSAAARLGIKTT